jgi:hypothetical protein
MKGYLKHIKRLLRENELNNPCRRDIKRLNLRLMIEPLEERIVPSGGPIPFDAELFELSHDDPVARWIGVSGNWSDPANWDIGVVPNNSFEETYSVIIDLPDSNPVITIDEFVEISHLTNAEQIEVQSWGEFSVTESLDNSGTIEVIDPYAGATFSGLITNDGTLSATEGEIQFFNSTVTNTSQKITADGGIVEIKDSTINGGSLLATDNEESFIQFSGDVTLNGVTWEDSGAGEFRVYYSEARLLGDRRVPEGVTLGVDLLGQLNLDEGVFTNDGVIELRDYTSKIYVKGDTTLAGSGEIRLRFYYEWSSISGTPGAMLTVGPDQLIHGSGEIAIDILNLGALQGDRPGETLTIANPLSNQGSISAENGGRVYIGHPLLMEGMGRFGGDPSGTIEVKSQLSGDTQNTDLYPPAATILFNGIGSVDNPQQLEVMSRDIGQNSWGLRGGLAYCQLTLGSGAYVQLVDLFDNAQGSSPEALYVTYLEVPENASLDLNGLPAYVFDAQIEGSVAGGSLQFIPHPASGMFPAEKFDAGEYLQNLALGDVDGDGDLDMVTADYSDVVAFLNLGDGRLWKRLPVGTSPGRVFLADVNGDTHLDIYMLKSGYQQEPDSISIFLGLGDGSFQAQSEFTMEDDCRSIGLGDVNGDGHLDLVTANWTPPPPLPIGSGGLPPPTKGSLSTFLGSGDGNFLFYSKIDIGDDPGALNLDLGDLDHDGHIDIALGKGGELFTPGSILIFWGIGDGSFQPEVELDGGDHPNSLTLRDVNGDGNLDIITANYPYTGLPWEGGNVSIFLGGGDGSFESPVKYAVGDSPGSLRCADLNNDNKLDLLTANYNSKDISLLFGTGDGSFQDQVRLEVGFDIVSADLGDLNGDGHIDMIGAYYPLPQYNTIDALILLGEGGGNFRVQERFPVGDDPQAVALTDIDHDGYLDIVAANSSSDDVSVLLGMGNGNFGTETRFEVGEGPKSIGLGDFNGDGNLGILTGNSESNDLSLLLGFGDGNFEPQIRFAAGDHPSSIGIGDVNDDGYPDAVIANSGSNDVSVLLGLGDGTFQDQVRFEVGNEPVSMALSDVNGDGDLDIITANYSGGGISVLIGLGNGGFQPQIKFSAGNSPISLALGDLNGDGVLDIVTASDWSDISVLKGLGDGRFQNPFGIAHLSMGGFESMILQDMDGDGQRDIIVAEEGCISVLLNVGGFCFLPQVRFAVSDSLHSISAGDIDGDSDLDIVGTITLPAAVSILTSNAYQDKVPRHSPSGETIGPVDSIRFYFSDQMDISSFSIQDDLASFAGPAGEIAVTGYAWVDEFTLEVTFDPQLSLGSYRMIIGPQVLDIQGSAMDLDRDGITGEIPDDQYVATFDLTGPRIISHFSMGKLEGPVQSIQLNFSHAMDQETFSITDDIQSFMGPNGEIVPTGYTWINPQLLEISFEPQKASGVYEWVIGPDILDTSGNSLDQDLDFIPGETPDDQYVGTFIVNGPKIILHSPSGVEIGPIGSVCLNFDHSMDQGSFSLTDDIVSFVGPTGSIAPQGYHWIDSKTLEITFEPQEIAGLYRLVIGPQILNNSGNPIDQDNDLVAGEIPDDQYTVQFILAYSGELQHDTIWNSENGIIVIDGTLTVQSSVTLGIEPGTIVKFSGENSGIVVSGNLDIDGTSENPVVLTSLRDDSAGGDTNGDGTASGPIPGDWIGLHFDSSSSFGQLENVEIRYAYAAIDEYGEGGYVEVRNSTFRNGMFGIVVHEIFAEIEAENCLIIDQAYNGLSVAADSREVFRNCTIVGNGFQGSGLLGAAIDLRAANLTLENTIVAFNRHGLYHDGEGEPLLTIFNSDFYNPDDSEITGLSDEVLGQNGNITADPLFVDRNGGNYDLSAGSAAVDSGCGIRAPIQDILGRSRYDDQGMINRGTGLPSYVDMGAFERQEDTLASDLAIVYISDPTPEVVSSGESFSIEWTVTNVGPLEATGSWKDVVYLSSDPYLSNDDYALGQKIHEGPLLPGEGYTEMLTLIVPEIAGPFYVIVRANAERTLNEPLESNNVMTAERVLAVDVPVLTLEEPVTGMLSDGQWAYYLFDADPGNTVILNLHVVAQTGTAGLYVRYGATPALNRYDLSAADPDQPDQELRIPSTYGGNYYLGIYANYLPGSSTEYTLSAELADLDIGKVSPNHVGNAEQVTIKIEGDNFDVDAQVQLISADGNIIEGQEFFEDSTAIFATFDLLAAGASPGTYDVVVTNPGPNSTVKMDALTIEAGGAPGFEADLVLPGGARPGRVVNIYVEYTNTGLVDLFSPMLILHGPGDLQWRLLETEEWIIESEFSFFALSPSGPANILRPGQSETLTLQIQTPFSPGELEFSLNSLGAHLSDGSEQAIDWDALEQTSRPADVGDELWNPFWTTLKASVGQTWGEAVHSLGEEANALGTENLQVYSFNYLFRQMVNHALGQTAVIQDNGGDSNPGGYADRVEFETALGKCIASFVPPVDWATHQVWSAVKKQYPDWKIERYNDGYGNLSWNEGGVAWTGKEVVAKLGGQFFSPYGDLIQHIYFSGIFDADYPNTENDLKGVEKDQVRVTDFFKNHAKAEIVEYQSDQIGVNGDEINPNKVMQYVGKLSGLDGDDIGVFHYSGHGNYYPDLLGYLEVHKDNSGNDWGEVPATDFTSWLEGLSNVGRVVVILDCCHSDSMFPLVSYNVTWLAAALDYETSREDPLAGGYFTTGLFRGLEGLAKDKNHDEKISVMEALGYAKDFVKSNVNDQVPQGSGKDVILLNDFRPFDWIQVVETNVPSPDHTSPYIDSFGDQPFYWGSSFLPIVCPGDGSLKYEDTPSRAPTADGVTWRAYCTLAKWDGGKGVEIYSIYSLKWGFDISKPDEEPPDPPPEPDGENEDSEAFDTWVSYTPEDMFGPGGYDPPGTPVENLVRYIPEGQTLNYRIEFWNKEDAPVPTQDAIIEDTLDPNIFDLSTFEFTDFGFLKWDVLLEGGQVIDTRVDLQPEMNIAVDVEGTFDPDTGKIHWWFHCVDPMTGESPEDPMAGFLPPYNPETGYEIGWVEFTVKPRVELTSGTQIPNQAFVEFDFAGDLLQHPAPKEGPWVNTVDGVSPDSNMLPLSPTIAQTDFLVQWSGQDEAGGSGISSYDIYVSIDGSPYTLWKHNTIETSATYHGDYGHSYSFYSVAGDNVGHEEAESSTPDTSTTLIFPTPEEITVMLNPGQFVLLNDGIGGEGSAYGIFANAGDHSFVMDLCYREGALPDCITAIHLSSEVDGMPQNVSEVILTNVGIPGLDDVFVGMEDTVNVTLVTGLSFLTDPNPGDGNLQMKLGQQTFNIAQNSNLTELDDGNATTMALNQEMEVKGHSSNITGDIDTDHRGMINFVGWNGYAGIDTRAAGDELGDVTSDTWIISGNVEKIWLRDGGIFVPSGSGFEIVDIVIDSRLEELVVYGRVDETDIQAMDIGFVQIGEDLRNSEICGRSKIGEILLTGSMEGSSLRSLLGDIDLLSIGDDMQASVVFATRGLGDVEIRGSMNQSILYATTGNINNISLRGTIVNTKIYAAIGIGNWEEVNNYTLDRSFIVGVKENEVNSDNWEVIIHTLDTNKNSPFPDQVVIFSTEGLISIKKSSSTVTVRVVETVPKLDESALIVGIEVDGKGKLYFESNAEDICSLGIADDGSKIDIARISGISDYDKGSLPYEASDPFVSPAINEVVNLSGKVEGVAIAGEASGIISKSRIRNIKGDSIDEIISIEADVRDVTVGSISGGIYAGRDIRNIEATTYMNTLMAKRNVKNINVGSGIDDIYAEGDVRTINASYIGDIEAGKSIRDIKSGSIGGLYTRFKDIMNISTDQDIEEIWSARNVKNMQAEGSIDNIFASGGVKVIRATELNNIFANADIKDISVTGDINLMEALRDVKTVMSQGNVEIIAHRDAVSIQGADGIVYYGRKKSGQNSDNLDFIPLV